MKIQKIGKICGDQDGAIVEDLLFRFDTKGNYSVYDLKALDLTCDNGELTPIFTGRLDRCEEIVPHSNAVFFGKQYFAQGDAFPLLYTNVYNNYGKSVKDDTLTAVLLCYRVMRDGVIFTTELVGDIRIGFQEKRGLWRSSEGTDVRPYGNFISSKDSDKLYAFVMIDHERITRYFSFAMPDITKGETTKRFGIKTVVLNEEDILERFDTEYHRYMQGTCLKNGKICSTEGFDHNEIQIPAIRVIDAHEKKQVSYHDLTKLGYFEEPEFIDHYGEVCMYSDAKGNLYRIIG